MSHKYFVNWTSKFKKDYKLAKKRCYDIAKLNDIIAKLADGETLPPANKFLCNIISYSAPISTLT